MSVSLAIFSRDAARYRELLAGRLPSGVTLLTEHQPVASAEIALCEPAKLAEHLTTLPKLRWAQSTYAGVDALMRAGLRQDYQLTNIRGIFGPAMSEYVFGYLFAHTRFHQQYQVQQQAAHWQPLPGKTLSGQTLLLLGTGDIAQHIAKTAGLFGMQVFGVNRSGNSAAGFERVWPIEQLHQALAHADVLVSVLPQTPQTQGLLNSESLRALKPGCLLFNVGRGSVLDSNALLGAIKQQTVAHAFLDVFSQEPLPASSPLWAEPNITLTPHVSAVSFPEQVVEIFLHNLALYISQKPLNYQVDFGRGY